MAHMVDVTQKPVIYREAAASGEIVLRPETVRRIREGRVEKGNVEAVASVAAIMAAKDSSKIIPLAHPIPITGVDVSFDYTESSVRVRVTVRTKAETGVEMDALAGVMAGLLAIWDMVKAYEKDERGQYPVTSIRNVVVESKLKGQPGGSSSYSP
ncbi:MAG: cyclic pyranopterin monophosphate synthase MoaC [Acidilobus sp.]